MKNLFTITLLMVFTVSITAQQYHPFGGTAKASWEVLNRYSSGPGFFTYSRMFFVSNGDTIIQNSTFKKIYFGGTDTTMKDKHLFALVHDSNKVVTIIYENDTSRTYNFNLVKNDVFHYDFHYDWTYKMEGEIRINEIDSMLLENGQWRKRYAVNANTIDDCHSGYWIEGIGNLHTPFYNIYDCKNTSQGIREYYLLYYYEDGVLLYDNSIVGIEKTEEPGKNKLKSWWNGNDLHLESKHSPLEKVNVYDYTGKLLYQQNLNGFTSTIHLNSLSRSSRILMVRVFTKNGEVFTRKLGY